MKPPIPVAALALALVLLPAAACDGGDGDNDYAERMAAEHAGEEPAASPAAETAPEAEVEAMEVTYATVGERPVTGYLARPAGGGSVPGLIVIHEWWGLNDNIRAMARRLAGEGYAALAVDLYGGEAASDPTQARQRMQAAMEREGELEENLRQAHAYLAAEQGAPKVGVIGWCFGGGWSLRTALLMPQEIDAAVIYYGRLVTDPQQLAALEMPILGLFGAEDQGIPVEQVRQFEAALEEAGRKAAIHVYEGADHAFANPSGERYDAEAAEDAWEKTTAFLAEHLKG